MKFWQTSIAAGYHQGKNMREIEQQVKELAAYVKALEALQALKRMLK